jgi:hypothetical protein
MIYVELLRAYRALAVFTVVIAACTLLAVAGVAQARGHIVVEDTHGGGIAVAALVIGAVYVGLAVAIALGNTLNRESATVAIAWTRPIPRRRTALEFVAVDLAAIAIAIAIVFAALVAILAAAGILSLVHNTRGLLESVVAGVGMAFMWYGLLQAATAGLDPRRGGAIRGLSAPVFVILAGLMTLRLPPALHGIIVAINVVNPFAWYSGTSPHGVGIFIGTGSSAAAQMQAHRLFSGVPEPLALVVPWIIGAIAVALAIRLWTRREA